MTQPIGGLELDAERGCNVAGVDPGFGEAGRRERLQREQARDPCDAPVRVAGVECRTHVTRRVVPAPADRVAARRPVDAHLRGGGFVDRHRLAFAAAEEPVVVLIELPVRACRRELVGLCEVQEHRRDVPPDAARRTVPVVGRALVDEPRELGVLRGQRDQDVVHGLRLRGF